MTTNALARPLPTWLDPDLYPFSPKCHPTEHGTMSYLDEGDGPPVLFVHGTPSWSFEFRAVIQALRGTQRCVAPDHLGFGLSDKPVGAPLGPSDHALRLRGLVEALDLRDVTLVVHDFGGPIGLPLALDTERVTRIVVLNSWMWPNAGDPSVVRIDRLVRSWVGRLLYRWLNVSPRLLLPAAFADRRRLDARTHRQYLAPFSRRADREAPYALARALLGADPYYAALWARRSEIHQPLTILWGDEDPAFRSRHLARWCDAFPRAHVAHVEDAGHFVAEERPDALISVLKTS